MTENLQPVIVQFEKYLAVRHNEKPRLINYAGGEAQHRLHQLDWLCQRIGKLEARGVELIHDITSEEGPSAGYVKDNPALLESRANSFEMETMVEAFYYFAFRLRQVIRQLPDLSNFECEGVRNVWNKLLEHPEGRDSGVIHGAFGYGDTETGPVLKMLRFPLKNTLWQDAGLWINAKELAQNLTEKINAARGES